MKLDRRFILDAVGGEASGAEGAPITGVTTDTRTARPGELFIALKGDRFDGHDHLEQALAKGCAALLVSRPPGASPEVPVYLVPDTLRALQDLANAWRKKVDPQVVAITGSSGKTTVKELLAAALREGGLKVHATRGNLNNLIGVPLTLLAMRSACEALVVEMGMNAPGEIARLAEIAEPDVGLVTNVHAAHIEAFGALEGIARAKGELLQALPKEGWAVIPEAGDQVELLKTLTECPVRTFGWNKSADCAGNGLEIGVGGLSFILALKGKEIPVALPHTGRHMAENALAAVAAADLMGVSPETAVPGLPKAVQPGGRGEEMRAPGGYTVIDESYNANPGSVAASLAALGERPWKGRRVAILGDMFELGALSPALHEGLADAVRSSGVNLLLTAGEEMKNLHDALWATPGLPLHNRETVEAWLGEVKELLAPGDLVLVKGSRGMAMERIVKDLLNGS